MSPGFWEAAQELEKSCVAFAVITLVSARGHVPQDLGAKAIITRDGLAWGTVGGGKVEARAITHAKALLEKKSDCGNDPELITWNLTRDIGMTCGGEVTFLFETHRRDGWRIAVFGAGHVAQALIRTLEPLDCELICIDPRTEWIEKLPASHRISRQCLAEPALEVEKLGRDTFFVIMTQGHATDVPILEAIFRLFPNAPYIGAIGSDVKALKLRSELKTRGVSEEHLTRLRSPIGLPLGGNQPAEIAISVAAELLQVRDSLRKT